MTKEDERLLASCYRSCLELAEQVGAVHAEVFGDVRPASTMVVVGLLDPRWLVEVELDAVVPATPA